MLQPFFSIIIPTYNRANIIIHTIDSIINQTYTNWELIIVDDGSTDNTFDVIDSYDDKRIRYFYKKNEERNIARNYGFKKVQGEYVIFFDSDDLMLKNHLKSFYSALYLKKSPILISNYRYSKKDVLLDKKLNNKENSKIINNLCKKNILPIWSATFKKDVLCNGLFLPDSRFTYSEDLFVWLKLLKKHKLTFSGDVTVVLNEHDGRSLNDYNYTKIQYSCDTLLRKTKTMLSAHQYRMLVSSHHSVCAVAAAKAGLAKTAIDHYIFAIKNDISTVFDKKLLAVIKKLILTHKIAKKKK